MASTRKGKRFSIAAPGSSDKRIHFGQWPYTGKGTFIDHNDENIRKSWRARHGATEGSRAAKDDPQSALYYAWRVLW